MLCGSIPPGVSTDFYTKLIRMARERKVKTLLDTDGDALLHGIEAGPTIVSPNQPEAERLLNRALITRAQFLEAATRIKAMGAEAVMLSLGGRGVVAVNENQLLEVIPPRTDAVSPLGAGDALAAAYVWAATKKKDFADCVRWAVAAGTASAMQPGLEFASLEQTKEVLSSRWKCRKALGSWPTRLRFSAAPYGRGSVCRLLGSGRLAVLISTTNSSSRQSSVATQPMTK